MNDAILTFSRPSPRVGEVAPHSLDLSHLPTFIAWAAAQSDVGSVYPRNTHGLVEHARLIPWPNAVWVVTLGIQVPSSVVSSANPVTSGGRHPSWRGKSLARPLTSRLLRRATMDEKTSVLIGLGAAVAANCAPLSCHYHRKATQLQLDSSDIDAAVAIGAKVKTGASIAVMTAVAEMTGRSGWRAAGEEATPASCCPR